MQHKIAINLSGKIETSEAVAEREGGFAVSQGNRPPEEVKEALGNDPERNARYEEEKKRLQS